MPLPLGLVIGKEKRFVLLDGTAQRATELIQIELFFWRWGAEIVGFGVQLRVAEKFEKRTVKLVGSGFSRHQHGWSGTRAPFRRIIVSENLKFLDGIDGR